MFEKCVFSGGPENCDFNSIEWYTLTLYYFGPSQIDVDHNPESYYSSCGSFRVYQRVFGENSQCSIQDLKKLAISAYECYLYCGTLYEIRRSLSVQGAFGVYPAPAFIYFLAFPFCSCMFVLGITVVDKTLRTPTIFLKILRTREIFYSNFVHQCTTK